MNCKLFTMPSNVEEKACKYPIDKKLHVDNLIRIIKEFYQSRIELNDLPSPISYTAPKSIETAEHFRQKGLALAKEGKLDEAHESLNRSLASAPPGSTELSLAYAERSAYSFSQGFYHYCSMDIEQALRGKLSKDLEKQLLERKRDAASRIKSCTESELSPHYERFLLERKILDRLQRNNSEPSAFSNFEFKNGRLLNPNSLVKFQYKKDASSYMVAKKDIVPGVTISAERCYSQTLNRRVDIRSMYCAFCFLWSPFLIPCFSCTKVMYCSKICRQKAYDAYHRTECKMIKFCFQVETDETIQQALQLLFVGTKQGKRLSKLMKTMPLYDMMIEEFRPPSELGFTSDYSTFLNTIRNRRLWDEETSSQRVMSVALAVNTVIALRNVSFFEKKDTSPDHLTEEEMFVALLLVDHLVLLKSLDSKILSRVTETAFDKFTIGRAFFPVQNLIGPSCYPNCQDFMSRSYRFLFTTRCIKAGETLSFAEPNLYVMGSWKELISNRRFIFEHKPYFEDWLLHNDLKIVFRNKKQKDMMISRIERGRNMVTSPDEAKHSKPQFLRTTALLIRDLNKFFKNPFYELILLELLLCEFMKSLFCDFYCHKLDFRQLFCRITKYILTRINSVEVNWSDEEDSSKYEIVDTQSSEDKQKGNFPLLSEKHKKMTDMTEENEDTNSKLFGVLDKEANNNNIGTYLDRNVHEIKSHTRKENNLFLNIHNTAIFSSNPSETAEKKSTGLCPLEHSVSKNGLHAKIIEEFEKAVGSNIKYVTRKALGNFITAMEDLIGLYSEKLSTVEKMACEENGDIDFFSSPSKIDEKVIFSKETSGTIEEEPSIISIENIITSNTTASVEAKINEAASSSSNRKIEIDGKTLDEATLLAFIDDIYQSQLKSDSVCDHYLPDFKSKEISNKLRTLSEALGERKDMFELWNAHTYLCMSIAYAPNDSEELARAYAERSAIIFRIYEMIGVRSNNCLLDVKQAIALDKCPEPMMKSLREREKECLRLLDITCNKDKVKQTCNRDATDPCKTGCRFTEKFSLSPKLTVLKNNTIVAIKSIMPGEELMKERREVTAVEETLRHQRCSHCLSLVLSLIPCLSCTQFMFCNEECRKEAYESYHRSECRMMRFFNRGGKEVGVEMTIALRAFFIGTKQGKDIPKLLTHFKRLDGTQEEDVNSGKLTCVEDFLVVLKNDESLIRRFEAALPSALEMVNALRSSDFFSEKYSQPPPGLSEEEILSTLLLAMNLISMGRCKSKIQVITHPDLEQMPSRIGYGIYIEQSRVRHSCYPNTIAVYRQGYRYLYSSRLIEGGEQVTYSEACLLKYFTLEGRKQNLAQEELTCECEACLEDWPSGEAFKKIEIQFKGNHSNESMIISLKMVRKKYSNTIRLDELHSLISDCIFVLCESLKQPSPVIVEFEEMLMYILNSNSEFNNSDWHETIRSTFISSFVRLMKCLNSTKL